MAHFAKISETNKVLNVVVVNDNKCLDVNNSESETVGQKFLEKSVNWPKHLWIKTSYNTYQNQHKLNGTPFRGNYAGIGYTWDEDNQIFWPKKPYASWVKHIATASWKSPLGDVPALTTEQTSQNEAGTHSWSYNWDENAYQTDNTVGWILTNTLA